ncbi:MAG: hypothetical protein BMS9Abin05_1552 [Rhodothermia bacterium]|nr:MAG: hypothetical protein BMS9Abin05_1552 [Rhodothermia bacterium]
MSPMLIGYWKAIERLSAVVDMASEIEETQPIYAGE